MSISNLVKYDEAFKYELVHPATQAAAPQVKAPLRQMAEINVHGEVFGREQVIGLIEKINDVQKDGHVISWKGI